HEGSLEDHLAPWSPVERFDRTPSRARREARDHILMALERWEDGEDYRFFIVNKANKKIMGTIGMTRIVRGVSQSAFIGYWIGKAYINQGFATEACIL